MPTSKKPRLSGLSSSELDSMLSQLRKLRSSVIVGELPDNRLNKLDNLIATLESRANSPQSLSLLNAHEEPLLKGILRLRSTLHEAIAASRTAGSDKLWSNDNLYKHLGFLVNSFMHNEISSRVVIDTFFFRSIAMVPSPQKMVVMVENPISVARPRMSHTSGIIGHTAVVAEASLADSYLILPAQINHHYGKEMIVFSAPGVKSSANAAPLLNHLPQVILELVARAIHLGKSHIRGALTTGFKWRFVTVDVDGDGGAKYWMSEEITWRWKTERSPTAWKRYVEETSDESDPALIVGILSSWISESFTQVNEDQWFVQHPGGV